jgi:hypothetical protein
VRVATGVACVTGVAGRVDGEGVTLPVPDEQAANHNKAAKHKTRSDLFNTLLKFKRSTDSHSQDGEAYRSSLLIYAIILL